MAVLSEVLDARECFDFCSITAWNFACRESLNEILRHRSKETVEPSISTCRVWYGARKRRASFGIQKEKQSKKRLVSKRYCARQYQVACVPVSARGRSCAIHAQRLALVAAMYNAQKFKKNVQC
ncbi:hypothetical protein IscW_ISCW011339 [Ixodes scapularis]|uniref:Uncharacterized protein n=1 Tax=Ixodes scapularis TaxID=6945 RepID=B7Q9N6_IXOSC|nr:hypothetical protein IscW_ISCW011339 [Ixodes scapularis]|eukprot:XP_002412524.1 hypothetical protein IscW_ISCW011339 [Ixodes scapularis]